MASGSSPKPLNTLGYDLAEETVQEAMLRALQTWPYQGVPENAAAWLFRVAHNIAIDAIRRNQVLGDKTDAIVTELTFAFHPDAALPPAAYPS